MSSVTIRISQETYERAQRLASAEARPIAQVIATALDRYERARMVAEYHASLERLYADPVAAAAEQAEIELWDAVSLHDLAVSLAEEDEA